MGTVVCVLFLQEARVGRHKAFDPDTTLDKALEVFWHRGYEATSMQELVTRTGLSRSSLYDTYGDKRSLFIAVLGRYETVMASQILAPLWQPGSAQEQIRQVFCIAVDMAVVDNLRRGCLMCNTAAELAPHDRDIAARVASNLARIEAAFAAVLVRAHATGEISIQHQPRALARFLANSLVGLRVMAKVVPTRDTLDEIVEVTLSVFG